MTFEFDEDTHIGKLDGVIIPSVTQVVAGLGENIQGDFNRGRAVHKACELLDKGMLAWKSVSDEILPYVCAWEKFVNDTGFKCDFIENRIVDKSLRFHGQPDRYGGTWAINPTELLVEIKSYAPTESTGVQLAGQEILVGKRQNKIAVEVKNDATYKIHYGIGTGSFNDNEYKQIFYSLLAIWQWKRNKKFKEREETARFSYGDVISL